MSDAHMTDRTPENGYGCRRRREMMQMPETKRFKNRRIGSKMCVKCGKVLTLDHFYLHRDWDAQSNRDAWCKECAAKNCTNKEETRKYCWYNNRRWSDDYWEMAKKKSRYA